MATYASITFQNYSVSYPDTQGGEIVQADVYVSLFDSITNQPVAGNGLTCSYTRDDNGSVSAYSIAASGSDLIGSNVTLFESHYDSNGNLISSAYVSFAITGLSGGNSPSCDIALSVSKTDETTTGANDGTITGVAISSFTGIQYSIDGVTYQSSGTFTGLAPGVYTVYAKDSHPCVDTKQVIISAYINPVVVNNTVPAFPGVAVAPSNVSRWNAAFNPIVLNFQRRDVLITSIAGASNQYQVTLNRALSTDEISLALNNNVYVKSNIYDYYGPAASHAIVNGFSVLTINDAFIATDNNGFVNIVMNKPNYKIAVEIVSQKTVITANFSSDKKGYTKADLSGFLKTLVGPSETNDYTTVNFLDRNLNAQFTFRYQEVWDGNVGQWYSGPAPFYVTYAAMQLGETNGGNMAEYVPFLSVTNQSQRAKWLTDYERPNLYIGFPFDLSFIYSEDLLGIQLYLEVIPNAGFITQGFLLNSDGGFLLNSTGGKIIISNNIPDPITMVQKIGINRVNIPQNFNAAATSAIVNIYYLQNGVKVYIMQPITINVIHPCDNDPYVYLKWVNHLGAWDYFRFGYNQLLSGDITNVQSVNRFVDDWEFNDTIQDLVQKMAIDKINVGADLLTANESKAIRWLRKSIKAQMLTGMNPVKWQTIIIEDGTYDASETRRSNSGPVSFTIYLPQSNIQFQ